MEDERSALHEQRFAVEKEFAYKRFISDEDDAAIQTEDDVIEIFSEKTCQRRAPAAPRRRPEQA